MNKDKILKLYQNAINRIDDYFEYSYESDSDKTYILYILDKLAEDIQATILEDKYIDNSLEDLIKRSLKDIEGNEPES